MTSRDRRTAIVGLTVVVALFTVARGVPALREWQQQSVADAADASKRLAALRATTRWLPAIRDSLRARELRLARLDSMLLAGASPAAAAAILASSIDDIASAARVRITAMQLHSDSAATGPTTRVSARVRAIGDVTGLAAFLRSVEGGDAALVVRELSVTQTEPAAEAGHVEALRIDVLVEALARITGASR